MRGPISLVLGCAWLVALPGAVFAQASITGVVRDSSGAVLPGVTVEATSPAVIEKARVVVTDASGQYRIITLPPGAYVVTFALSCFSTLPREGIELTGTFTATIDADLRVGSVEETVTVTGEVPVVDVQSATQQRVIGQDVVDTIPSGRMPSASSCSSPASASRRARATGTDSAPTMWAARWATSFIANTKTRTARLP